jgi:hypothetical protein
MNSDSLLQTPIQGTSFHIGHVPTHFGVLLVAPVATNHKSKQDSIITNRNFVGLKTDYLGDLGTKSIMKSEIEPV